MRLFATAILFIVLQSANAQLSVSNISEFMYGNIPGTEPKDLTTFYDQFNAQYGYKWFRGSIRVEQFYSPDSLSGDYARLSQFLLSFRKDAFDIKAGHFYETLGMGLLVRGYEIKNAIFEDQIYRVRQGFYKDIQGVSAGYTHNLFSVKLLSGRMLNNQYPLNHSQSRTDYLNAGELAVRLNKYRIGAIFLRNNSPLGIEQYGSLFLGGNLGGNFSWYGEMAHQFTDSARYFGFNNNDAFGGYLNISYSGDGYGLSLEAKNYNRFFIGSGLSDPPTLVKEHTYKLLNRSVHVSDLTNERGLQFEAFYAPVASHFLTFNYALAQNRLNGSDFYFNEYFLEWQYTTTSGGTLKVFADYSKDEIKFEVDRLTGGLYYLNNFYKLWSFMFESEIQKITRAFPQSSDDFVNSYVGIGVNRSTSLSLSFILEFTNDPVHADLPNTNAVEDQRFYPGVNLLYKPDRRNTLQLFAGERRGGPACTAGICYEVLDFKGVELKWTFKL